MATLDRSNTLKLLLPAIGLTTAAVVGHALFVRKHGRPLEVVKHVDLARYAGRWFEIARIPNRFERRCVASTAYYALGEDGVISVRNVCRVGSLDGPLREMEGTARVIDPHTNARLSVQLRWPFHGEYWIIDLDRDYQFAAVGEPSRRYLWILSRTPTLDSSTYQRILQRVARQGYDPGRLCMTPQPTSRRALEDLAACGWDPPIASTL